MGIGNVSIVVAAAAVTSSTHYPSWGSGTPGPERTHARSGLLITPHGDREPSRPAGAAARSRSHYPSWGSGTGTRTGRSPGPRSTHYPSWGSGTLHVRTGRSRGCRLITPHGDRERSMFAQVGVVDAVSLPLMGIGNRPPFQTSRQSTTNSSLPLMGIGNGVRDENGVVPPMELITPHGDRELNRAVGGYPNSSFSLPLMGIGNWHG